MFDPNRRGTFHKVYRDPERVPMILLGIGMMIVLICFLVWAIS